MYNHKSIYVIAERQLDHLHHTHSNALKGISMPVLLDYFSND